MTQYQSKLVDRLNPYVPGEQRHGVDVVKLNTNENPYPPSPKVMQAIAEVSGDDLRRYPDPEATALCKALAEYEGVRPDQVYVANGSDETLGLAFMAFFTDKAALQFPQVSYSFYPVYCKLFNIEPNLIALNSDFSLDINAFTNAAGGICFPNPNAPTGLAVSKSDIESLLQRYTTGVVLVDEAYADFGSETSIGLIDQYPNLLVTRTFSKVRSLAGMRIGAAFGDAKLISAIASVKNSFNSYPLDAVAQAAAVASVADDAYYQNCKDRVIKTRTELSEALQARGFKVLDSAANFIFVSPVNTSVQASELFDGLNQHNILVRYWPQDPIKDWLRISIGTDDDTARLITAIDQVLS